LAFRRYAYFLVGVVLYNENLLHALDLGCFSSRSSLDAAAGNESRNRSSEFLCCRNCREGRRLKLAIALFEDRERRQ
jgi:hypothetical protein